MVQEWTSFRHPSSSSRSTLRLLRNICFRSEGRVGVASPIRLIATPRVGHGGSRLLCIMLEIFLEKNLFFACLYHKCTLLLTISDVCCCIFF